LAATPLVLDFDQSENSFCMMLTLRSWLCWSMGMRTMHPLPGLRQSMVSSPICRDRTRLLCLPTRPILSVSSILKTTLDGSRAIWMLWLKWFLGIIWWRFRIW
jgi:hypothetical protein